MFDKRIGEAITLKALSLFHYMWNKLFLNTNGLKSNANHQRAELLLIPWLAKAD